MSFTQDLFTQRRNYEDGNVRIGQLDRIWYDEHRNAFYIGDDTTPGGRLIGGSNGNVGATGANGVSISNATIIGGNLLITFSNSSGVWAGNVVGPQGPAGNTFIAGDYGAFYDTTTQTISNSALAYKVPLGNTTVSSGVSISNSNIVVSTSGVYDIQYSIQFTNSDNANHDIDVWFRINNIDLPDSNSRFTIHSKNSNPGAAIGKLIAVTPIVANLAINDTAQIMWATDDIGVAITTFAAQTNPTRPRTPGVIVYVNQIA